MSIVRVGLVRPSLIAQAVRASLIGAGTSCTVYYFQAVNPDSFRLGVPFSGKFQLMVAATSETGINPVIVAGRIGSSVASADPVNEPNWNRYEITATALSDIVDTDFTGVIT